MPTEPGKRAGVCHGIAPDGTEPPVIDVTPAAFAVAMDAAEQQARTAQFLTG